MNGFLMAFNREICRFELPGAVLFDPSNVNVGNEDDLCARVGAGVLIALDSFVFHYKGVSFASHSLGGVRVVARQVTWLEAKRTSFGRRLARYGKQRASRLLALARLRGRR